MISSLNKFQESYFNSLDGKRFYSPAKIHWGKKAFSTVLELLRGANAVVFFDQYFDKSVYITELQKALSDLSFFYSVSGSPSPEEISSVSVQFCSSTQQADVVLAIGGGSTIDFAKAFLARQMWGDIDGVGMGERRSESPINNRRQTFIAMPTTAGTGAECSRYYVTYSQVNRKKIHGKSWQLVADWVFLDPELAMNAPNQLKIESAFDAFVHLTESYLCMEEASWVNGAICRAALTELRSGLDLILSGVHLENGMLQVMAASSIAGIAISNVRTGHIHEMAGAFLEGVSLNHPQSLWVFFKSGLQLIESSEAGSNKLMEVSRSFGATTWREVVEFWESAFSKCGTQAHIELVIRALEADALENLRTAVIIRTVSDAVWATKECPVRLTRSAIDSVYRQSVAEFRNEV